MPRPPARRRLLPGLCVALAGAGAFLVLAGGEALPGLGLIGAGMLGALATAQRGGEGADGDAEDDAAGDSDGGGE
jgi:hypothetical protein